MKATNAINFFNLLSQPKLVKKISELGISGYLVDLGWLNSAKALAPININNEPIPWYSYPAYEFLKERITKELDIFEFGSGNSTVFFSKHVNSIIAVEHDKDWFEQIRLKLEPNGEVVFIELDYNGFYCNTPKNYNKNFDVIIVDGRDRMNCFEKSITHLKPNGIMILDDSERPQYQSAFEIAKRNNFKHINFFGMAAGVNYRKCTTIFYRSNNCLGI